MTDIREKREVYNPDDNPLPYPFKSERRNTLCSDFNRTNGDVSPAADTPKPRPTS